MSDSIWKKEIHLRKPKEKKVEAAPPPAAAEQPTSVWKKEIRLRKPKEKKVAAAPAPVQAPGVAEQPTSVWEKEIHPRNQREPLPPMPRHLLEQQRRPRNTVVVPVVPQQSEPVAPKAPEPLAPAASEPVERLERWSARITAAPVEFPRPVERDREPISFIPRSEREQADSAHPPVERHEPDSAESNQVHEFRADPQPPVEAPPVFTWSRVEPAAEETSEPASAEPNQVHEFHELSQPPVETPPAFTWSRAQSEEVSNTQVSDTTQTPELPVLPPVEARPAFTWSSVDETPAVAERPELGSPAANQVHEFNTDPQPPDEAPPAVTWSRVDETSPVAETPEPASAEPTAVHELRTDPQPPLETPPAVTWSQVEPAEASVTEVSGTVHEPEPVAAEAPAAAASAEKVPLLKREIRLRKPKGEKPAKPVKAAKTKAKKERSTKETTEKVPLLKREIHLGRKPKPKADRTPASTEPPKQAAPAPKVSPLKREIHLRRKKPTGDDRVTRVVGLRIGSSQLAAAYVQNNGSAQLVQLARKPLERGLVVAGEVREPVALAKELKAFFSANKLPKKDIRLGIASNRIGVRVLDVPAVADEKQFENAVRFRAQEVLPIPVTDAVLDHVLLAEESNGEGEAMRRILLVFAHRELVTRYVDVCRQAGLRLTGIDLDAFALLRAVAPPSYDDGPKNAVVAVAVGHERTVFAVQEGDICEFTRVLEWGSSAIDVAIARALNLTPSQAEPVKHALVLDATEPPEGLSAMEFEAVRAAAKSEVAVLVRELVSSLRFYQSRPGSLAIADVLLSGGGAQLGGFAAELERGLGAPVRIADPLARVTLAKKITVPDDAGSLAIAVGLGIEA